MAISRLQEGAKKRSGEREGAFAILLTDGAQTAGAIEPIAAAELSADYGIPIYTIGAGRDGMVIAPRMNAKGERIGSVQVPSGTDEPTLKEIARVTGGEFYRAENTDTIQNAFDSIDEQSKIEFESHQYSITTELFPYSSIAQDTVDETPTLSIASRNGTLLDDSFFRIRVIANLPQAGC